MLNIEKSFYKIQNKLPAESQKVIAYNKKLDEFIDAVFKNGKFYNNNKELANITRWKENNDNVVW